MWQIIIVQLVISALIYIISPRPPKPAAPSAGKFDVPAPRLGRNLRVVFGEVWIEDADLTYFGNQATAPIKKKGGK